MFLCVISADISVKKDVSVFHSAVKDAKNNVLTNDTIDEHLLQIYVHCNKNDVGGYLPETNKYHQLMRL